MHINSQIFVSYPNFTNTTRFAAKVMLCSCLGVTGGKAAAKKAQRPSDTAATADGAAVVDPPEASGNAAADTEGAAYTGSGRRRRKDAGAFAWITSPLHVLIP